MVAKRNKRVEAMRQNPKTVRWMNWTPCFEAPDLQPNNAAVATRSIVAVVAPSQSRNAPPS